MNSSGLEDMGEEVAFLVSLAQVSICGNPKLQTLPSAVGRWEKLEKLFLNDNPSLTCLPDTLCSLPLLSKLYVNNCALEHLPTSLGELAALEELYVANNTIAELPLSLASCRSLNKLHAPDNKISALPPALGSALELVNLSRNAITDVPPSLVASMPALKFLHLAENELTDFPFESLTVPPDGTEGALRLFDVEGNTDLMALRAEEIRGVKDRLVKPWEFGSK
jgi:Leucine-rich repeat (LRR) protein